MTAQVHERLIFEGTETSMAFCPPIPNDHPHIISLSADEVRAGMAVGSISRFIHSTGCWRQYIGT